ncbi:dTMP kinase [Corynebacterium sp. TA-R-1]|uniref:Thymidylate kinase n=1 Tax=Corynebacterium stercoris TaxID=2943490 RepID=A0ABT1G1R4_9CORY|nr:dTMP kinase [Corynebacterium stercoris]MCP1387968.1 dTMP kinase [Corynebacterium stercoris]
MIIAVEGIDGAGKRTLVDALLQRLPSGITASTLAFPRYDDSAAAQLAQAALHGQMGDMTDSPYAMAAMFALDRHGALDTLTHAAEAQDELLILDRYAASNAAYTWARSGDETAVRWVAELEFERLGLPRPDLQVLVDTSPEVASARAVHRAEEDPQRARDRYERDAGLQVATFDAYRRLAERSWAGPWVVSADAAVIMRSITDLR